ncbi:MAG: hypothetical protein OZ913_06585 [Ignavibacteriaceae bacterium]|nr:hypothetical protein [Ignavibacteriaceae bacterium]
MKKLLYSSIPILLLTILSVTNFSCSAITTISNLQRLQFKLGDVHNFNIAGVKLSNARNLSDLNLLDAGKLTAAFASEKLPVSFTLDVLAKNPNTPGGYENTTSALTRLGWRLLIDNKEVLDGVVNSEVTIPGTGQHAVIPINVAFDLWPFFNNMGYEGIINLALALGGVNGSSSRLTLKATPSMQIFGVMVPTGEITIVDSQFN